MSPKRKNPFSHSASSSAGAGKKRARQSGPSLADPSTLPPRAIETVHRSITGEVQKGNKAVFRALKKARGFESRKLIKRLKGAREKPSGGNVESLEAELASCKTISAADMNLLAAEHTLRTLGKKKRVVSSLLWPPALRIPGAPDIEKARANVVARLFGIPVVREAVREVVDAVESAMGLQRDVGEKTVEAAVEEEEALEEEEMVSGPSDSEVVLSDSNRVVGESEEFVGFSDSADSSEPAPAPPPIKKDLIDTDALWERLMDPNANDFAEFEERIRVSDDEADDEEDAATTATARTELERTDDEWSGDDEEEKDPEDDSEDDTKPVKKAPAAKPVKAVKSAKSTPTSAVNSQFLPSLMAGYVSGGDSDPDADWYKNEARKPRGPPEKKERKNRMGQQARRALWERKFGKRATHLQKQEQEAREKRERREARAARGGVRQAEGSGEGGKEVKKEGPLHPSWEAARRAKEKQAAIAAMIMKPVGKKIMFD